MTTYGILKMDIPLPSEYGMEGVIKAPYPVKVADSRIKNGKIEYLIYGSFLKNNLLILFKTVAFAGEIDVLHGGLFSTN